ncbi:hypothetical protein [Alkalihalobacillus sp. AL-G]|uniref:hypothetical protein n=1 Tax=Alkalihalobacillus sp. AL-G TaxID=2926399 RepID=UPI00351B6A5B
MPQYYDNEEFDFESNAEASDSDRPYGCYPDYKPYPGPPPRPPVNQVAGAQTGPAANLMYCLPIGGNGQVAGVQTPQVAGAQSPYNISPYGGGAPFYPPYPPYPYGGYGGGWVWAVIVILFILLLICGAYWWYGRFR